MGEAASGRWTERTGAITLGQLGPGEMVSRGKRPGNRLWERSKQGRQPIPHVRIEADVLLRLPLSRPLHVVALGMIVVVSYGESARAECDRLLADGADKFRAVVRHGTIISATTVRSHRHGRHRLAWSFRRRSSLSTGPGSLPRARSLARRRWPCHSPPRSNSCRFRLHYSAPLMGAGVPRSKECTTAAVTVNLPEK